jgi:hypothetical protein
MADDKIRIQDPSNFLSHSISHYRRNKPQVTDIDAKNRDAGTSDSVGGLEKGAVATAGYHEVGFQIPQISQLPKEIFLRRQRVKPLLLHALALQHGPERSAGLFRMRFGLVDDDGNPADFHRKFKMCPPPSRIDARIKVDRNWGPVQPLFKTEMASWTDLKERFTA